MLLNFNKFYGENKYIPTHQLPEGLAQSSINTFVEDGTLYPIKEYGTYNPNKTFDASTKTIYLHKDINNEVEKWQSLSTRTPIIRHPVGDDTYQRIFYVSGGKLKYLIYSDTYEYDLLLPQPNPLNQLTVSLSVTGTIQRFLAYTFVTDFGEESALSLDTSGTVGDYVYGNYFITNLTETSTATVTWVAANILNVGSGNYNGKITKIRFYMTSIGSTTDDYKYVGETTIASQTFTITNAGSDAPLKETIVSPVRLTYADYSTISLQGVCKTIFGSIITYDKSNIYISDPYNPFSINASNVYSVESQIKGVYPYGNSIIVLTTTIPYIMTGSSASAMYLEKAQDGRSVSNIDCVVNTDDYVVFPTDEGIYIVSTGTFALASSTLISKQNWRDLTANGANLLTATHYKDWYLLSLTTGITIVFDFKRGFMFELDFIIPASYYDSLTHILYVFDSTKLLSSLYTFNEGTNFLTATVQTSRMILNRPYSLKYLRVLADTYTSNIVVKFYADGILRASIVCSSDKVYKLPSLATREVEIEIDTNVIVRNVLLSDNIKAIQEV